MFSELVQYAAQLRSAPPYHQETRYLWSLEIGADGGAEAPRLVPLTHTVTDKRGNVRTVDGSTHLTPVIKRTAGVAPLIPHDGLGYVLGWCDQDSKPERVSKAHSEYVDLIEAWASSDGKDDPVAQALRRFVLSGAVIRVSQPEKWTSKDNVLITVDGLPAHHATSLRSFWTRHVEAEKGTGSTGECLICGKVGPVVDTLPQMVKGPLVPGGQSSGVAPISVNAEAFGYNLTIGLAHVPVCVTCARAIPAALNDLLADEGRSKRAASTVSTWWIKGGTVFDPLAFLDTADEHDVVALIESVESAKRSAVPVDTSMFNGLVVSGNGPRMVVHNWTSVPLAELQRSIARWFADTEMEPERSSDSRYVPLWRLATATGRFERQTSRYRPLGDPAGHHPNKIEEDLRHTALGGSAPPHQLAAWVIARVASDHHVDTPRAALLRLTLRRTFQKGNLMSGLDPQCTDPCYVAGRLFAEYEQLQYRAATMDEGGAPNATFADRNFSGAITNPAMAVAAGEKQAAAWLSKLRRKGWDAPHVRSLDEMMALLDPKTPLPTRATIEQQAMFILGYHHQRAANRHAREEAARRRQTAETSTIDNES